MEVSNMATTTKWNEQRDRIARKLIEQYEMYASDVRIDIAAGRLEAALLAATKAVGLANTITALYTSEWDGDNSPGAMRWSNQRARDEEIVEALTLLLWVPLSSTMLP